MSKEEGAHHADPLLLEEDDRSRLPRISKEGTGPTGVEPDGTTLGSFGDERCDEDGESKNSCCGRRSTRESISRLGGGGEEGEGEIGLTWEGEVRGETAR